MIGGGTPQPFQRRALFADLERVAVHWHCPPLHLAEGERTLGRMPREPLRADDCAVCRSLTPEAAREADVVFENELWHVRHAPAPFGVPGWMMLLSQRHVPGPAHFDDLEAESFGVTLRHLQRVLEEVTFALRIYTAAMGESSPHFRAHMVPRTASMPKDAKAWGVFDLQRAAAIGEIEVDLVAAKTLSARYREALRASPPPR